MSPSLIEIAEDAGADECLAHRRYFVARLAERWAEFHRAAFAGSADVVAVPRHAVDLPLDNWPATAHPRRLWGTERGGDRSAGDGGQESRCARPWGVFRRPRRRGGFD